MYAGKRFSYTPPVYTARNILAALDHNYHMGRGDKKNANGEIRYHRVYNKKSSRWTVYGVKEEKTYKYIPALIKTIILARLKDTESLTRKKEITDIRAIDQHLAPTKPPPSKDLVKSNFQGNEIKIVKVTKIYSFLEFAHSKLSHRQLAFHDICCKNTR